MRCGKGRDSLIFSKYFDRVVSVDFSQKGLDLFQEEIDKRGMSNIEIINMEVEDLKLAGRKFDFIYSNLVIHYFDDEVTSKIYSNLYDLLEDDGKVIVLVKSTNDRLYGKGEKVGHNTYDNDYVRHFFDEENIRKVVT